MDRAPCQTVHYWVEAEEAIAARATSEDLHEWHEVEVDDDDCSKPLEEEEPIPESHSDVVTNPKLPHDVEEDDDKNAKTGENQYIL